MEHLLSKYKPGQYSQIQKPKKKKKTKETYKFVPDFSQSADLRCWNKHVSRQNLSIYYRWINITKQYRNSKLKIIAPAWDDEFELPDGSYFMCQTFKIISNTLLKYMKH